MDELFRWQKAIDDRDRDFIPKTKQCVGSKYIIVGMEDAYDWQEKGMIVTLSKDDKSACPQFGSLDIPEKEGTDTEHFYWCEVVPYNE